MKLKKAYNTLKMVERQATVDRGPMSEWAWTGTFEDFETYFKPYFDIMKDCERSESGCFAKEYRYLNGAVYSSTFGNSTIFYKFITPDGISFAYYPSDAPSAGSVGGNFFVDINGTKEPNKFGRDFFEFDILSTLGIKPHGAYRSGSPNSSANIDTDCSTSGGGWNCATKVLSEGAINY